MDAVVVRDQQDMPEPVVAQDEGKLEPALMPLDPFPRGHEVRLAVMAPIDKIDTGIGLELFRHIALLDDDEAGHFRQVEVGELIYPPLQKPFQRIVFVRRKQCLDCRQVRKNNHGEPFKTKKPHGSCPQGFRRMR